jgi:hypothetical protein
MLKNTPGVMGKGLSAYASFDARLMKIRTKSAARCKNMQKGRAFLRAL